MNPSVDRPHMPGYGISDDPAGLLPWSHALALLEKARTYWVATCSPDGPHVAAVWGVWFDDALCFSTGGRSRKARNLAADPRCSVAVPVRTDSDESVVLRGTARRLPVVPDGLAEAYVAKYGSGFPPVDESPLFAVSPETVIALTEDFTGQATRFRFP